MRLPGTQIGARRGTGFGQALAKPKIPPPEAIPAWWHPARPGVVSAPGWFQAKLERVDDKLAVTWDAYNNRWNVFMRKPSLQNKICWGWVLLFHTPVLDERIFHRLFAASADKWGNAKYYFMAVERELEREREKTRAANLQESIDRAMVVFDHSQIRVGYGKSNGSKFSTYHS